MVMVLALVPACKSVVACSSVVVLACMTAAVCSLYDDGNLFHQQPIPFLLH
jgi:hypothetical protein